MIKTKAASLLAIVPKIALATGVLNVLLAGSIAPLSSSASPTSITYDYPSATLTSGSTTCIPKGGVGPYTYGWSWASGGSSITINSASSATTSFGVTSATVNTTYTGTAQCLATDRRSLSAPYTDVSVSLSRTPLFPPSVGTATLVAGANGTQIGYESLSTAFGSLSPTVDYNGKSVTEILCTQATGGFLDLTLPQAASNPNYIIGMVLNGTLYTQPWSYNYNGTYGTWSWSVTCPMTSGNTYSVYYY